MSSINSVTKLQIPYFSMKNKEIKNLQNGEKKWPNIGISAYYLWLLLFAPLDKQLLELAL